MEFCESSGPVVEKTEVSPNKKTKVDCTSPAGDLVLVRKSEVPAYLHSGEFFQSLNNEDGSEQISVPSNTLKMDTNIKNNADLEHLLCSLRFWGVSSVCEDIVSFCLSKTGANPALCKILRSFAADLPYAGTLAAMIPVSKELDRMKIAVQSGLLEIVRQLPVEGSTGLMGSCYAAQQGHLHILQYIHEHSGQTDMYTLDAALQTSKGLPCVQYLHQQCIDWPDDTLSNALVHGSKKIFHYALQNGATWTKTAGNVELACRADPTHLEALKYAIQHGYPLEATHTLYAAKDGALESLQVLHEANCPWTVDACKYAAYGGHLSCLQYLHDSGCPWDSATLEHSIDQGQMQCVQYAHQHGCPVPDQVCKIAATHGRLNILRYLHEAGLPWGVATCKAAAEGGHIDCLKYLHEHGCAWNHETTHAAAQEGHQECLQYAHEQGCAWDENVSAVAAEFGDLPMLKYCHENGCPVTQEAFKRATQAKQAACVAFIKSTNPKLFK